MTDRALCRLATYGTLSPGESNHGQLDGLRGNWSAGRVRGRRFMVEHGPAAGYPGLVLHGASDWVPVMIFESDDLPSHWERLDAFEGEGYTRTIVPVETDVGSLRASIFLLAGNGTPLF